MCVYTILMLLYNKNQFYIAACEAFTTNRRRHLAAQYLFTYKNKYLYPTCIIYINDNAKLEVFKRKVNTNKVLGPATVFV